jgi:hypothetical protein
VAFDPIALRRCCTNSRVPAIRVALLPRAARSKIDPSGFQPFEADGDEIGGEVSASRTWWSTATGRWRGVDCQDAPAIRECLERRWLHELMRPSGRRGTLHARCHALARRRACIAFGLMEPERPKVDRAVLDFVKAHVFDPADFVIRIDGGCRLDPEMARTVVTRLWT